MSAEQKPAKERRRKAWCETWCETWWRKKSNETTKTENIGPGLDLKDQVISINRVTKVVKGGKNLSFAALVVVGDESGHVGFGTGKAREVPLRLRKGRAAKKNLIRVPLIENTLPHNS